VRLYQSNPNIIP